MIYQEMQDAIEQRYDLTLPCRVMHFVSHDHDLVRQITGEPRIPQEMLLVREETGNLDVTLFLEQTLIDSIKDGDSTHHSSENFYDYCTVLEGVSHFVYLVWNAQYGRQVKPIEMELQAEVDKFVFSALAGAADQKTRPLTQSEHRLLSDSLFQNVAITHAAGTHMYDRYRVANDFARHYCRWLSRHYEFTSGNPTLFAELARFYRMNATAKFEHIKYATH